jgi:hypothetical protein
MKTIRPYLHWKGGLEIVPLTATVAILVLIALFLFVVALPIVPREVKSLLLSLFFTSSM